MNKNTNYTTFQYHTNWIFDFLNIKIISNLVLKKLMILHFKLKIVAVYSIEFFIKIFIRVPLKIKKVSENK